MHVNSKASHLPLLSMPFRWFEFFFFSLIFLLQSGCDTVISKWVESNSLARKPAVNRDIGALILNPSSTYIMARGESVTMSATGGTSPFTFSDLGTGFVNTRSGVYAVPINAMPNTDTVSVKDSLGRQGSTDIAIQSWKSPQTVVAFPNPIAGQTVRAITMSPNGNRFVGIYTSYDYQILKSTNNGASYSTVDSFNLYSDRRTDLVALKAKSNSILFAAGYATGGGDAFYYTGFVRRSLDGGATWSTVHTFSTNFMSMVTALEVDASGAVYINALDDTNWIIKKSTDDGATWSTVFTTPGSGQTMVYDSVSDSIYAAGKVGNQIKIMKSVNGGSSWNLVDTFQGINGITQSTAMAVRGSRVVYSGYSGNTTTAGFGWPNTCYGSAELYVWYTRVSQNSGTTWTTTDEFQKVANRGTKPMGIIINSAGEVYVGGYAQGSDDCKSILIRKSLDGGLTWSDLQYDNNTSPTWTETEFFGSFDGSEFFHSATRFSIPGTNANPWVVTYSPDLVRQSIDKGVTWTASNAVLTIPNSNRPTAIVALDSSTLMAATSESGAWVVKKSMNSGTSWTNVDYVMINSNPYAQVSQPVGGIVKLSTGAILVAGYSYDANNLAHWTIRKTTDQGTTWTTKDDFNCSGTQWSSPSQIVADSNDNIFVAGYCYLAAGGSMGVLRKSSDLGNTWTTVSTFQRAATKTTQYFKMALNASGQLFILGTAQAADNTISLVILKSIDGGLNFSNVVDEPAAAGVTFTTNAMDLKFVDNAVLANALLLSYVEKTGTNYHFKTKTSPDGGTTWTLLSPPVADTIRFPYGGFFVATKKTIDYVASTMTLNPGAAGGYTGQFYHTGIWRTRDAQNWSAIENDDSMSLLAATACGTEASLRVCAVGMGQTVYTYTYAWILRILN